MSDFKQQLLTAIQQMSAWEFIAVALAVAYLLLAVKQNSLCWYCAFASTAIYTVLFWDVQLLMESGLNVYYMVMAVYGWWQWRHGGKNDTSLPIRRWGLTQHLKAGAGILTITLVSGALLMQYTEAAWPYLDSFTTWASVITTFMVARKILENWLYWMVINSISIFLFIDRGLYLTALLLVSYLIISIFGLINWRRDYRLQTTGDA
ncbi:nicotinamide riboside transporter PnuC [Gilvimarinus sp. 1_MG-2023]|uniref:nicotinamide riboside transporter PnuC n=1 Tax=Gilvimarinus sp. 1_MG-2023 TaxID=3062638 RepID=UPI0026E1285D|nr:nicotinamide riboside transporter PnuC [Gilvimarinus sp. 1_MG-2023]MDO6747598.1 nicotinamide riboside transporter PnuC [Gilvimarinus sp. 1_MG-2023]